MDFVRYCSGSMMSWEGTYPSLCWHTCVLLLSSSVVCRGGSSPEHLAAGLLFFSCGCSRALALSEVQHQFVEDPIGFLKSPAVLPAALQVALRVVPLVYLHMCPETPAQFWTAFVFEYSCAIGVGCHVPLCVQAMHAVGSAH